MPEKAVDQEMVMLTLLALFSPPIAVLCMRGCSGTFALNLFLTTLLFVPGAYHAFYLIHKHHKRQKEDRATSSVQIIQTVPQNSGSGKAPSPVIQVIQSPPAVQTIQAQPAIQAIQAPPSPVTHTEQVVVTAPSVPLPAAR